MADEEKHQRKSAIPAALECALCQDVFNDPRNLPCGHTFCMECLSSFVDKSKNKKKSKTSLECSLCRKPWEVPQDGVASLPKNYVADGFKDCVPSTGECVLATDGFQHGPSEYFCVNCWDALCSTCRDSHHRNKVTGDHVVKLVRELNGDDIGQHRKQALSMCTVHKTQEVVMYCKKCCDVACTVCFATKHANPLAHECIELDQADVDFSGIIREALEETKAVHAHNKEELMKIIDGLKALNDHQKTAVQEVKATANEAREKVRQACEEAINHINATEHNAIHRIVDEINSDFNMERAEFVDDIRHLETRISFCERLLLPSSSVVERAKLVKQISSQPAMQKNNKILLKDNQQYITESADVIKKYEFSFATSLAAPVVSLADTCSTPEIVQTYIQFLSTSENKIVCGTHNTNQIRIYDATSKAQLNLLSTPANHVYGVVATNGNIVCSLTDNNVAIMMQNGTVILNSPMTSPRGMFLTADGDIIMAAGSSIFKSVDDGCTWKEVLQSPDPNTQLWYVVLAKHEDRESYWVLEVANEVWQLSEYSVDVNRQVTMRVVDATAGRFTQHCRLAYDGEDSLYVTDFTKQCIHMYSVGGSVYRCQLGIPVNNLMGIVYDKEKALLLVDQSNQKGCVEAYKFEQPRKGRSEYDIKMKL
jgi:hypothetical protein